MNCQDIARVIDSSTFSPPGSMEFRACDEHARSCRHCAELWFAHAQLVAEPIPGMPPELSVRCLTLAAAKAPAAASRHRSRMIVAVVGLVALAAAAMMLTMNLWHAPAPEVQIAVSDTSSVATSVAPLPEEPPSQKSTAPVVEESAPQAAAAPKGSVPLVPAPLEADQANTAMRRRAIQKLVELYPELVQGPPTDEVFCAAILLRVDGKVLDHAMQREAKETANKECYGLRQHLPSDAGQVRSEDAPKGARLSDGRTLSGALWFYHLTVANNYDPARSNLFVDEMLRERHADLMLPASSAGVNYVTVLLTEGAVIKRQYVELVPEQEAQRRSKLGATERAQDMARRLGVGIDQFGLMGYSQIRDDAAQRSMYVDYVWQRVTGESAPVFRQGDEMSKDGIDRAAAVAMLERVMPDAFMGSEVDMALGYPVVVLSEDGRVLRTGRIKPPKDVDEMDRQYRSLLPDRDIAADNRVILTNAKGERANVGLIWQASPATREAMENERKARSGK